MNITQMLQATSTTAQQQRLDNLKKSDKEFDLQSFMVGKREKNDADEMQKERENEELNRDINREINKAFMDSKTAENMQRYKESVAKFRNSIKVAFSDEVKDDYKIRNGYIPFDWEG